MTIKKTNKRDQAVIDLINQMFVIATHDVTFEDIKDRKDNWYQQYTMTEAQSDEWKEWGIKHLREKLKMNKVLAEKEMSWFMLMYGLKFSNFKG